MVFRLIWFLYIGGSVGFLRIPRCVLPNHAPEISHPPWILSMHMPPQNNENSITPGTARAINSKIIGFFNDYRYLNYKQRGSSLASLQIFIHENIHVMDMVNIVTLLHRCTKNGISLQSNTRGVDVLGKITSRMKLLSNEKLGAISLGNLMFSLKNIKYDKDCGFEFLRAILPFTQQCKENLSAQAAANSLYGLQNLNR